MKVQIQSGTPKGTFKGTIGAEVVNLIDLIPEVVRECIYAFITIESGDVRFSLINEPSQNPAYGHLLPEYTTLELKSSEAIYNAKFISANQQSTATIFISIGCHGEFNVPES